MEITPLLMCCCSFQGLGKPEQWLLDSCCLRAVSMNPRGEHLCISQLLQPEPLPAPRVHSPESRGGVLAVKVFGVTQHQLNSAERISRTTSSGYI